MNPFDPEVLSCPYAFWARARRETPVLPLTMPDSQLPAYFVTRKKDIEAVLGNPETFSSRRDARIFPFPVQPAELAEIFDQEGGYRFVPTFIGTDSPVYEPYRKIPEDYLLPENLERWRQPIQLLVEDLVASLPEGETFDFLPEFARRLPVSVVRTLFGFPVSDEPMIANLTREFFTMLDPTTPFERRREAVRTLVAGQKYLVPQILRYRERPADNLLSFIANAPGPDGNPLSLEEALSIAYAVIIGGNEAIGYVIGGVAFYAARDGSLWKRMKADRQLVGIFLEEALRLASPTSVLPRMVAHDTELAGTSLPAGATVLTAFGSGNRDEDAFEDPLEFRLDRDNASSHITFGFGSHRCAGQHLARLQLRISIECLLDHLTDFALAIPEEQIRHAPTFTMRSIESLPVWIRFERR